jgi:hypothetical protein
LPTKYPTNIVVKLEINTQEINKIINLSTPDLKDKRQEKTKLKIINGSIASKSCFKEILRL